jgi:Transcriptional regulatory protein, C terminal
VKGGCKNREKMLKFRLSADVDPPSRGQIDAAAGKSVQIRGLHPRSAARLPARRGWRDRAAAEIFEVLRYLVENAGRLVSKDELIKAVWPNVVVTTAPRSEDRHQRRQRPVKTRHYRRSARVENPRSVVEASADLDDRKGTTADEKPDRLPRIR